MSNYTSDDDGTFDYEAIEPKKNFVDANKNRTEMSDSAKNEMKAKEARLKDSDPDKFNWRSWSEQIESLKNNAVKWAEVVDSAIRQSWRWIKSVWVELKNEVQWMIKSLKNKINKDEIVEINKKWWINAVRDYLNTLKNETDIDDNGLDLDYSELIPDEMKKEKAKADIETFPWSKSEEKKEKKEMNFLDKTQWARDKNFTDTFDPKEKESMDKRIADLEKWEWSKKTKPDPKVSIVDFMNSKELPSDKTTRLSLAKSFWISDYAYTSAQNTAILEKISWMTNEEILKRIVKWQYNDTFLTKDIVGE